MGSVQKAVAWHWVASGSVAAYKADLLTRCSKCIPTRWPGECCYGGEQPRQNVLRSKNFMKYSKSNGSTNLMKSWVCVCIWDLVTFILPCFPRIFEVPEMGRPWYSIPLHKRQRLERRSGINNRFFDSLAPKPAVTPY